MTVDVEIIPEYVYSAIMISYNNHCSYFWSKNAKPSNLLISLAQNSAMESNNPNCKDVYKKTNSIERYTESRACPHVNRASFVVKLTPRLESFKVT